MDNTFSLNASLVSALRGIAGQGTAGKPIVPFTTGIQTGTAAAKTITEALLDKVPQQAQQFSPFESTTEQKLAAEATGIGLPACAQAALTIAGSTAALQQLINKALHPPAPKKKTTTEQGQGQGQRQGQAGAQQALTRKAASGAGASTPAISGALVDFLQPVTDCP